MPGWLEGLLPKIVASFLARWLKDWRRDGDLRDLGAAQQSNKDLAEAEKRGQEGDGIDQEVERSSMEELRKQIWGDK